MFASILNFELRYWFRGWMIYIVTFVLAALFFGAATSENITIGGAVENTNRNAPFVIQSYFSVASILTLLMTTAFASSAATRDFAYHTNQILFTTPLRKWSYLLGRFTGSSIAAIFPMLGISIGILLASIMPWNEPERWGPNSLWPHVAGFITFAIPNTLITAAMIFSIAAITRSSTFAFVAAIVILVGYGFSQGLVSNLDNEQLAMLLDPLGVLPFSRMTRYWTITDRNTLTLGLSGMLLFNRLLWLGGAAVLFGLMTWRFSFAERTSRRRWFGKSKTAATETDPSITAASVSGPLPVATVSQHGAATWHVVWAQFKLDFAETIRSRVFLILVAVGIVNLVAGLMVQAGEGFGNQALPVTYAVIDSIRGGLYLFLIAIITHYCGVLVWKEREAKLDEVVDALPYPTWTTYLAKTAVMMGIVVIMLLAGMLAGIAYQTFRGYTRYQFGLYGVELLVNDLLQFAFLVIMAMAWHVVSPNKYVGYFGFIAFLIANAFVWFLLDWSTLLVKYGSVPSVVYSDFYRFAPFATSVMWFSAYWIAGAGLLAIATAILWQRGKETRWAQRLAAARQRLTRPVMAVTLCCAVAMTALGGWIHYNTQVVNKLVSSDDQKDLRADYEKAYRQYIDLPQPRVTSVSFEIDIFPERRGMRMLGRQTIENKHDTAIGEIHLVITPNTEIRLPDSQIKINDERLYYQIHQLDTPMRPGETRQMEFVVEYEPKGFEQSPQNLSVVQNGTFFNNSIAPQIGYQSAGELSNRTDRRKRGLGEPNRMAKLESECSDQCGNTYISNNSDWVNVETIISTSADQIAIAPGSLIKEWTQDDRRYFQYRLDRPSLNFYSFMSADYVVSKDKVGDVDIEIYHLAEHEWNVPRMLLSVRKSLEYYTENFGTYYHKQARIIEFPRVASFAQAFPGTMPYSEGVGFIADLEDEDAIDSVFYIVAHEMAHQWWAHQVVGANMEGATLLSETLAQYSALMVMEREYGRDMMRKFLRYEMDNYLRSRGSDSLKEKPLSTVGPSQDYVHYRKGSVAFYHLKEMIGEDKINAALRQLIDQFAYAGPPYPTSLDLIAALREQTPADQQGLLVDLFDRITLFDNRIVSATYQTIDDDKVEVTVEIETKKLVSQSDGSETEVAMNDEIEIGAFSKPEAGTKYGRTLYRHRLPLTAGRHTHTFVIDEMPHQAGVDPFALLIDRVGADNLMRVTKAD